MIMRRLILTLFLVAGIDGSAVFADTGASCIATDEHSKTTFLLLDGSDSKVLGTALAQFLATVKGMIRPGERVVAGMIADKRANAKIFIDVVNPEPSAWQPTMLIRKKQKNFADCLKSLEGQVSTAKDLPQTAILETLSFVNQVMSADAATDKRIMIFSDMIQNSDLISFYKLGKETSDQLVTKVKTAGLVFNFGGANAYVAGVGGTQSDKQARQTEDFWRNYFSKSGINLKFYGPVLVAAG